MGKTNKILAVVAVLVFLGMGMNAYAGGGSKAAGAKVGCELSGIIGTHVTTPEKEYLGKVKDFVVDKGRISFAILSHGGVLGLGQKLVAVPYDSLSYVAMDRIYTLNISKEKFDAAPAFDRALLADRGWATDIYRYFGQQPYWTDEGGSSPTHY